LDSRIGRGRADTLPAMVKPARMALRGAMVLEVCEEVRN